MTSLEKECIPMIDPQIQFLNTPLLIIYLSAIETLISHREIDYNRVYFLRLCIKRLT